MTRFDFSSQVHSRTGRFFISAGKRLVKAFLGFRFRDHCRVLCERLVMMSFLGLLITALAFFHSASNPSDTATGGVEKPGGGIITNYEIRDLWIPETLKQFASDTTSISAIKTHEQLRRFLEELHLENLRYAVRIRGYQVNGGFADTIMFRKPYDAQGEFLEFLDVVEFLGGLNESDTATDLSIASVHTVDDEFFTRKRSQPLKKGQEP